VRRWAMIKRLTFLADEVSKLKEQGLYVRIRTRASAQGAWLVVDGKRVLNMCSNNYLGLANDPKLVEAAKRALDKYGVGAGAVRPIAGNLEIHNEFEEKIAKFKRREASLLFQSGWDANLGTIPAIVGEGDVIFSEELNHASIIDGCRLSRARRYVYPHLNTPELEKIVSAEKEARRKLIVTDGVFSMDGDLAPLPEIVEIAEKYDAITMVDDAHGEGVLGDHGRGIVDHYGLYGRVDIEMGTLSKAFGVMGGYIAGNAELIEYLRQRARPFLFSSALNPAEVAAAIAAVEILEESDELVRKLWDNTNYFKGKLSSLGFDLGRSRTPITPLMVRDEKKAYEMSRILFEEKGVFAQSIVYPTVPRGTARLRLQPSAVHSKEDLDFCIDVLEEVGRKLALI